MAGEIWVEIGSESGDLLGNNRAQFGLILG